MMSRNAVIVLATGIAGVILAFLLLNAERPEGPVIGKLSAEKMGVSSDESLENVPSSESPVLTVPFAPPQEKHRSETPAEGPARDRVALAFHDLPSDLKKRLSRRIAVSSLMPGLAETLQLQSQVMTLEAWESIHELILQAELHSLATRNEVRKVLEPVLATMIAEGRAERGNPTHPLRIRTGTGFELRTIMSNKSTTGVVSNETYSLSYLFGQDGALDEQLRPIEAEYQRQSAQLGERIRTLINR